MITVDCRDVESILRELLIYVADQVAAVPIIKFHQFVLDPIAEDQPIDNAEVITSIKEFLDSIGEKSNFAVISNGDTIKIQSINGRQIKRTPKPNQQMFSCTHCGHITQYEVEHNNHVKIHYI